MDQIETIPKLPARPTTAHKGDFGRVGVVGGSSGSMPARARMIGAPALCARGAIRAGCGLVRIAAPEPILNQVLAMSPFATGFSIAVGADADLIAHEGAPVLDQLILENDALVIGPGLGSGEGVSKLVLRAMAQEDIPVIADADALNALANTSDFATDIRAHAILTPHPGEAKRLCDALAINAEPAGTDAQRVETCSQLAQRLGCIVVLKGARTVVSDGQQYWICPHGHPCMASGGTGDVLAGIIGSLVAQSNQKNTPDLFRCAMLGVQIHAVAGEQWAKCSEASGGLIATELADMIPAVLEQFRED
jgi:hydroxyethylthiazole kinase-like uncharacterized protein yjeF